MSTGIGGQFFLALKMGTTPIPVTPSSFDHMDIIYRLDRFLPSMELALNDDKGMMTHLMPFDSRFNTVSAGFSQSDYDEMVFDVYRRFPVAEAVNQARYDVQGLLSVNDLFEPKKSRGFVRAGAVMTIKDILVQIGTEMGCTQFDISDDTNVRRPIIQPSWTNATFLNFLRDTFTNAETGYFCFVVIRNGKKTFVFKGLTEMLRQRSSYTFLYADKLKPNQRPAYNLKVYDNYATLKDFGTVRQDYGYYDYFTGQYITGTHNVADADFTCLSDYINVNTDDKEEGVAINSFGRTNEYDDFPGAAKGRYYTRLNSLIKAWIDTDGLRGVEPGQVIKLIFPHGAASGNMFAYQHGGFWLVERVIHSYADMFRTRLLLTRPGSDSDKSGITFVRPKRAKR